MIEKTGGDYWQTPKGLKEAIFKRFNSGVEMFDPCPVNPDFDGLSINWRFQNYVNPPYSRGQQILWIKKAHKESQKGNVCTLLLPADTSTTHWHYMMKTASYIHLFDRRIRFEGASGSPKFGSALVRYFGHETRGVIVKSIHWNKKDNTLDIF